MPDSIGPESKRSQSFLATLRRAYPEVALHERLLAETERASSASRALYDRKPQPTVEAIAERLSGYQDALGELPTIAAMTAAWASDAVAQTLVSSVESLANSAPREDGFIVWRQLRLYPASILYYTVGITSLWFHRYAALKYLTEIAVRDLSGNVPGHTALSSAEVFDAEVARAIPGLERHHTPTSDHLHELLKPALASVQLSDEAYDEAFDLFEYLLALLWFLREGAPDEVRWIPVGRFVWRARYERTNVMVRTASPGDPAARRLSEAVAAILPNQPEALSAKESLDKALITRAQRLL